jgi:hypothetical protein
VSSTNLQQSSPTLSLPQISKAIARTYNDPNELAAHALFKMSQLSCAEDWLGYQTGYQIISEFLTHAYDYTGYHAHINKVMLDRILSTTNWALLDTSTIDDPEFKAALLSHYSPMELS